MFARIIKIVMNGKERDGMLSLKGIMCSRYLLLSIMLLITSLATGAVDPKLIYTQSTDALYNLDFNTAQRGYETLTQDYPDNPDYWNALAASIWLHIMYDQQKLNVESFSGGSLGTKNSRDVVNPAEEKRLRETINVAIAKADAILKKNPKDVRALYAKGISNATLASFEASAKRAYFSAGTKAKIARDLHQQVLELDPSFDDARTSVGAFNYVVGVVPGFVRFLLMPIGIRSAGKDVGIQQLEIAAAKGKTTATDARMMLIVVYNREKRYDDALKNITELHARYPRNFIFELAKASTYGKMKRWDDAVATYKQIIAKVEGKKDGYERLAVHKVYYSLATSNVERLQFEEAINAFNYVAKSKEAPPDDRANAYLWMGKIYDSDNKREKALEQYDAILALNCDSGIKSQAQQYKRRPFK
jgi:tetratricopeptide (TPR) repeat protein